MEFKACANIHLCPVRCYKEYEERTLSVRTGETSQLFLAVTKPHAPVASSTIARWLKSVLASAGVDISSFSAHSTRGAAASAAAMAGVTTKQILNTADWSSANTFENFYHREEVRAHTREAFTMDCLVASKSRSDMSPNP